MTFGLPSKTRLLLQIRAVIITVLLCIGPVYMANKLSPYIYIAVAALAALGLFAIFFYIPRFVKQTSISVSKEGIIVKYGVFYKVEQIMPLLRLIFTETHQTPLARAFGLCAVSFLGAKTRITVPEMDISDAKRLFELVKSAAQEENDG